MAVTKAITKCTPYVNSSSKVDKWDIEMKYENDSRAIALTILLLLALR